ncbi:hypothetical protein FQN54_008965 [Arachnomyces sp. PD_36]|nr:hypothetical protein FQN54_008965 [Arachnomyces sp. PD_36]
MDTPMQSSSHASIKQQACYVPDGEISKESYDQQTAAKAIIRPQCPDGRKHAGEVRRRRDRQASALPPPETSSARHTQSTINGNPSRRARHRQGQGGFNSDSDSDHDHRQRQNDRADDDPSLVRRGKHPVPVPSSHQQYDDVSAPIGCTNTIDDGVEECNYRDMQR